MDRDLVELAQRGAFDHSIGTPNGPHDELIVRPYGSQLTNLTAGFEPGVCCGRWSPDSTALLVAATASTDNRRISSSSRWTARRSPRSPKPGVLPDFSWGAASVP